MKKRTTKRYYTEGESVYVKPLKELGVVKKIDKENKKITVEIDGIENEVHIKKTVELNLWEVDKDKRELFKEARKGIATILFARVHKDAIVPSKENEDGGYDIYAAFDEEEVVIEPHKTVLIPTGLLSSIKDDNVLIGKERGSTGVISMALRAGVIDSGFRGEIKIVLNNTGDKKIIISKTSGLKVKETDEAIYYPYSKAIAQLLLVPVPKSHVKEISEEELKAIPSKRGEGMLGHSGK